MTRYNNDLYPEYETFKYPKVGETNAIVTVHIHDLQATILHLLGINAHHFSYPFQGLDQRLIGPNEQGKVIKGILS